MQGIWSAVGNAYTYQWQRSPDGTTWANISGADTQFAIASIPPSYAGQDVAIELFDLGEFGFQIFASVSKLCRHLVGAGRRTLQHVRKADAGSERPVVLESIAIWQRSGST